MIDEMVGTYTDSCGVLESLRNPRVHRNEQIILTGNLNVPRLDLALDPLAEGLPDDPISNIDYKLLRQLGELLDNRHVEPEVVAHSNVLEDVLDG